MEKETDILTDIVGQDIMDIIGGYVEDIEENEKMEKIYTKMVKNGLIWNKMRGFMIYTKYEGDYEKYVEYDLKDFNIEYMDRINEVMEMLNDSWEEYENDYNDIDGYCYSILDIENEELRVFIEYKNIF